MRSLRLLVIVALWIVVVPNVLTALANPSTAEASAPMDCNGFNVSCTSGSQCCSGVCHSNVCSCSRAGSPCGADTDCCGDASCVGGSCSSGSCGTDGAACMSDGDCCSSLICASDHTCGACGATGQDCHADSDCCSDFLCNTAEFGCEVCGTFDNGISCGSDSDCCGPQMCKDGSCCLGEGDPCDQNDDQCCNFCTGNNTCAF